MLFPIDRGRHSPPYKCIEANPPPCLLALLKLIFSLYRCTFSFCMECKHKLVAHCSVSPLFVTVLNVPIKKNTVINWIIRSHTLSNLAHYSEQFFTKIVLCLAFSGSSATMIPIFFEADGRSGIFLLFLFLSGAT